ncbi:MAG: hypothetical protein JWQ08_826, partial [Deinococcus sp.]|nr:hypothetical protein [Deinococcus sp.]
FQVYGDGVKLYDSGLLTGNSATRRVNVGVVGRQELRLVVTDAGNGISSGHADWADPRLDCATSAPKAGSLDTSWTPQSVGTAFVKAVLEPVHPSPLNQVLPLTVATSQRRPRAFHALRDGLPTSTRSAARLQGFWKAVGTERVRTTITPCLNNATRAPPHSVAGVVPVRVQECRLFLLVRFGFG